MERSITSVWTTPGAAATSGRLTSEVQRLIDEARMSVVCSSYNFTPTSRMWEALRAASERDGVTVTLYLDVAVSDTAAVANHLRRATVFRPTTLPGTTQPVTNHAKFVIIDHALVLLTSANFSHSAEHTNIELGLLVQDSTLAESIESQLRALYDRVLR